MRVIFALAPFTHACLWIPPPEATPTTAADTDSDTPSDSNADTDTAAETDTGADTGIASPPTLDTLAPGSAGRLNVLLVSEALAGAELWVSSAGVVDKELVPGCPSLSVDVSSPTAVAGPDGTASLQVFVPEALLEDSETYQVVQPQNCTISEPLAVDFPGRIALGLGSAEKLAGEADHDQAGYSVSGAGDVDGDLHDDVLIGAWHADGFAGQDIGRMYLTVDPVAVVEDLGSAEVSFEGEVRGDSAGFSVSGAGDVNGDDLGDVLVGAPFADSAVNDVGRVYLFVAPLTGNLDPTDAHAVFEGQAAYDEAGVSVAGAGDVNGGGLDDIIVGAHFNDAGGTAAGRAYLFLDPAEGTQSLGTADAILTGETEGDEAGGSVSAAGDVDGDGRNDLLVGARYGDTPGGTVGRVYLLLAPVTGNRDLESADAVLEGEADLDEAGTSVSGAGDADGDGLDDLLVGASSNDAGGTEAGRVYVVSGRRRGTIGLETAEAILTGEEAYSHAGTGVSEAGNVDGDVYDDLLVGAPGGDVGRAYLLFGPVSGTSELGSADAVFTGENEGDEAGFSVSAAGDVDGDGLDDLLVGAPLDRVADQGAGYLILGSSL